MYHSRAVGFRISLVAFFKFLTSVLKAGLSNGLRATMWTLSSPHPKDVPNASSVGDVWSAPFTDTDLQQTFASKPGSENHPFGHFRVKTKRALGATSSDTQVSKSSLGTLTIDPCVPPKPNGGMQHDHRARCLPAP